MFRLFYFSYGHVWAIRLTSSFVYLSQGYRRPCVIDLKVGLRTYSERGHDSAYVAKRSAHDKRSGQFEVGFKVCGMQTWERSSTGSDENGGEGSSPENSSENFKRLKAARSGTKAYPDGWTRVTKPYSWARGLCSKGDARKALEEFVGINSDTDDDDHAQLCFLNAGGDGAASSAHSNGDSSNEVPSCSSYDDGSKNERSDARRHPSRGTKSGCDCGDSKLRRKTNRAKEVYGEALSQIGAMRAWFATQRELHLLGSSVLIVYEGDEGGACEGNDDAQLCHRSGPGVRVKAIDFCNYVEGGGELDTNFGAGLDRLSQMLESIVADS